MGYETQEIHVYSEVICDLSDLQHPEYSHMCVYYIDFLANILNSEANWNDEL